METEGFVEFEIIINDLLSSFRFIWIPIPKDGPGAEMVRVKINVKPEFTVT